MERPLGGGIRGRSLALIVALASASAACDGGGSNDCVAGQTIACTCTNGLSGAQTCRSDGSYGACSCSDDVDAGPPGNGEIFVANHQDTSIRVFDRMATGDVAPLRIIRGGNTRLVAPVGIAVDVTNGEIFVANAGDDSITVYPIGADGNVAPVRRIAGAATGIAITDDPQGASGCSSGRGGLFLDSVNDELVVPCTEGTGCLLTFSSAADGDVAPIRTIAGASTTLPDSNNVSGVKAIHVDQANDETYVLVRNFESSSFHVFGRTATGDAAPLQSAQIFGGCHHGLQPDLPNGEIWINLSNRFDVYAATAEGTPMPLRTIPFSGGEEYGRMFLDAAAGEAIVFSSSDVSTFDTATGTRTRVISGAATGLGAAADMAVAP